MEPNTSPSTIGVIRTTAPGCNYKALPLQPNIPISYINFNSSLTSSLEFNTMGATPELPNLNLDPASEYRAWQALSVYFTVLLNRQIRRRWQLEHECMQDRPVAQWFRPVIFLEPVPQLHRPQLPTVCPLTMANLKTKVHLLRGRVEKGKELASQIERRMLDSKVDFPTHFCHTCVVGCESESEILLTKCGHRVCRTCLSFGVDECGVYECSICFVPTSFVAKSPLSIPRRAKSEELAPVGHKDGQKRVSFGTFD